MEQEMRLRIEINNVGPVELTDLTASLNSLADEYRRHLAAQETVIDAENIKLYVKEIRTGSIITELVALAPYALPLIDNAQTIIDFAGHLKSWYDHFLGKGQAPAVVEKASMQNLSGIMEPVAKSGGSQMNIAAINVQGDIVLNLTMGSIEANAVQNAAKREIERLREPVTGLHQKVLMYWFQARNDMYSKAGDRAIVESIHAGAVKTTFDNDAIKAAMLLDEPHPFKKGFVVDLAVETVSGKPALYRVTRLHEAFDLSA